MSIETELGIQGLRASFLRYTAEAFGALPRQVGLEILDIGCGAGTVSLELARLCDGRILGIDVDEKAVAEFAERIETAGLSARCEARRASFLDDPLPASRFDVLWEEGVFHMLELDRSLAECARLLRPDGTLVCAEAMVWVDAELARFGAAGFELVERIDWEHDCWWSEYFGPLEERIRRWYEQHQSEAPGDGLARYEAEVSWCKAHRDESDCCHLVLKRRG